MASSLHKSSVDSTFNLDPLLDTITCLVGVLLVVMAIIQVRLLNSEPGRPSEYMPPVTTSQMVDLKKDELAALVAELEQLRNKFGLLEAKSPKITEQIIVTSNEVAELSAVVPSSTELAEKRKSAEKERDLLREQQKQEDKALAVLRAELAKYTVQIEKNRVASVITLPEARMIKGTFNRVPVMIRYGRVYLVKPEELAREFYKGMKEAAVKFTAEMNVGARLSQAIKHFGETRIGTDAIRLRLESLVTESNQRVAGLRIKFEMQRGEGESLIEMQRSASAYRKLLASIDPKADYLDFDVWSDSFEAFLTARSVASEMHKSPNGHGTALGIAWTLYASDEDFSERWIPGRDSRPSSRSKQVRINN